MDQTPIPQTPQMPQMPQMQPETIDQKSPTTEPITQTPSMPQEIPQATPSQVSNKRNKGGRPKGSKNKVDKTGIAGAMSFKKRLKHLTKIINSKLTKDTDRLTAIKLMSDLLNDKIKEEERGLAESKIVLIDETNLRNFVPQDDKKEQKEPAEINTNKPKNVEEKAQNQAKTEEKKPENNTEPKPADSDKPSETPAIPAKKPIIVEKVNAIVEDVLPFNFLIKDKNDKSEDLQ